MAQAISKMNSSENSEFGSFLADLVGLEQILPKSLHKKNKTQKLIDIYNKKLINKAMKTDGWVKFVDYLKVELTKENRIKVVVKASDYIKNEAYLLEYGTPSQVASPLLRVAEAEFNTDFDSKRMFKL